MTSHIESVLSLQGNSYDLHPAILPTNLYEIVEDGSRFLFFLEFQQKLPPWKLLTKFDPKFEIRPDAHCSSQIIK